MAEDNNNKTPHWKRDFPIDQEEATHVSRREFAKFLGLFSGALALGNGAIVLKSWAFPERELEGEHYICDVDEVPVGSMKQFDIEGTKVIPYILIHLEEGEWRAFEQKCTHLACAVRYRHDIQQIECPCHQGFFDPRTGVVIQGPPPRPLPQLEVKVADNKVYVKSLSKEKPYTS
jgi:cytochrome b6-f complex iron-sulfur subunit